MVTGRVADHIGSFTTLINSMIAAAYSKEQFKTLEKMLEVSPGFIDHLPDDLLLNDEVLKTRFIQTIRVEHVMVDQIIAQAGLTNELTEDLFDHPPKVLVTATSYLWRVFLLSGDLDSSEGIYNRMIEGLSKPSHEVFPAFYSLAKGFEKIQRGLLFAMAKEQLDFSPYVKRMLQAQARARLMKLALAVTAYYNDKGQYPASQADLIPYYMPEKLTDPFTGQGLAMETVPGGLDLVSPGMQIAEGDIYAGPKVFHLRLPKIEKQG